MKLLSKSLNQKFNKSVEPTKINSVKYQQGKSVLPKFTIKSFIDKIKEIKIKATNGEYHSEEEVQKDILLAVKEAEQQIDNAENSAMGLSNQSKLELQQLEEKKSGSLLTKLSFAKLKEKSENLLDSFQTKLGKAIKNIKEFDMYWFKRDVIYFLKRTKSFLLGLAWMIFGLSGIELAIAGVVCAGIGLSKYNNAIDEFVTTEIYLNQKALAEVDLQQLLDDLTEKETIYNYAMSDYSNGLIDLTEYDEIKQAYTTAKSEYKTEYDYINSQTFIIDVINTCLDAGIENLDQNVQYIITEYENGNNLIKSGCITFGVGMLAAIVITGLFFSEECHEDALELIRGDDCCY